MVSALVSGSSSPGSSPGPGDCVVFLVGPDEPHGSYADLKTYLISNILRIEIGNEHSLRNIDERKPCSEFVYIF